MGATVFHALTATTPDNTSYEIRPIAHWNASHVVSISLAGSEVIKAVQIGANSMSSGTLSFANSNGVSVGLNGSTITLSHNGITSQSVQTQSNIQGVSAGTTSAGTGAIVFSNSNGMSFGLNGQTVTGSYSVPGATVFSNSNNVSFGLAGSTITGSASFAQSNQQLGAYAVSNTTQSSSGTIDARSLSFQGAGIASVGISNGSVIISVPSGGGAGDGGVGISAGASSVSSGNVVFSNSNSVSFGLNGSTLTASFGGLTSQSNQAFSAPGGSSAFQTLNFANSNGVSFSNSGGSVVGSVAAQTAQTIGIYGISNTTGASSSSTYDARSLSFVGAGVISVGQSGGSIQISAPSVVDFTQLSVGFSTGGNTAGTTGLVTGQLVLAGGANITLSGSTNAGSMTLSVVGGAGGGVAISGGTQLATSGSVVFSNSNGVSFGLSNSSIMTASVAAQTAQTIGVYASSNTTGQSSSSTLDARSLSIRGIGNISAGLSGNMIVLSVGAGAGGVAASAGTQSVSTGTLIFANSNSVSFGMSGSSQITASFGQSAQTMGLYAASNSTVNSSGTIDVRSLSIAGMGIISVGTSNGSLILSAPAAVDFTQLSVGFSTLGNTAGDTGLFTGRVVFVGSNNITLSGSSSSDSITVSFLGAAGGGVGISAGSQSVSTGTMVFSNSNNVSFGMSGSSRITASVNAISNINVSGGTTSNNLSALVFSNSNNVSMGLNGSTLTASVAGTSSLSGTGALSVFANAGTLSIGVPQMSVLVAGNTTGQSSSSSFSLGSLNLSAAGGMSIGHSAGTIIFSGGAGGGGGGVAISAGTQSVSTGTMVFSNSNGVTFGMSGSSQITASVAAQSVQSIGFYASSQTYGQSSSSTVDARSISVVGSGIVSAGLSAGSLLISASQSNQAASASNGSFAFQTLGFSNANNVTFGSSAGSIITASVAAQSVQTIGFYATGNTTNNSSSTFDARTVGTISAGGALTVGFSNGSIQMSAPAVSQLSGTGQVSISTNGSTISIGVPNPSTNTDGYNPYPDLPYAPIQIGQGSLLFDPQSFPNIAFDRLVMPIFNINSSLSTGSHSLSFYFGLYSRNGSTLSLVGSTSRSTAVTQSGTVGSYSLYSGMRNFTIGSTATVTAGKYWMAFASRSSSAGADGSYSNIAPVADNTALLPVGVSLAYAAVFGSSANATNQLTLGQGYYSATTTAIPGSVAFSQINGSGSNAGQQQVVMFANSTV